MRPTHYLAIAVRLLSILLLFYALRQSSFLFSLIQGEFQGLDVPIPFAITTVVLPFLASVLLWYFPMIVAKSILKPELDQEIQPLGGHELLAVLVLGISLYFMYFALIDAVYWVTLWFMSERSQTSAAPLMLTSDNRANMIATAAECIVSICLLMKARTVAHKMISFTQ